MPSCGVCPSVCLSRSSFLSKQVIVSSDFFHHRVAKPFWFLPTKPYGDIPTGTPLTGASNAGGYEKNCDFWPISRFISLMIQDRAIVTMEDEYETVHKLSNGAISNDLEWPLIYYSTLSNSKKMVQDRAIFTMADQSYMLYRTAPFSTKLNNP